MIVATLQIQPQQQSLNIEIDPYTKILEILEYVKEFLKISEDIQKWTCYSEKKCQYLDQLSVFGNIQNEKLTINTAANAKQEINAGKYKINNNHEKSNNINPSSQNNQIYLNQNNNFIQNNNQLNEDQQQFKNQQPNQNKLQEQNQINIYFIVLDGKISRKFNALFCSSDTLENVADTVLAYLGVTKEIASCDLIIFNQNYNNPQKREKTLLQLSIKGELTIEARLRWTGGY